MIFVAAFATIVVVVMHGSNDDNIVIAAFVTDAVVGVVIYMKVVVFDEDGHKA